MTLDSIVLPFPASEESLQQAIETLEQSIWKDDVCPEHKIEFLRSKDGQYLIISVQVPDIMDC